MQHRSTYLDLADDRRLPNTYSPRFVEHDDADDGGAVVFGRFPLRTAGLDRLILGSPGRQRVVLLGVAAHDSIDVRSRVLIFRNMVPVVVDAIDAARAHDGGPPTDVATLGLRSGGCIRVYVRRTADGRPLVYFARETADGDRLGRPSMIDGERQVRALESALAWLTA